MGPWHPLLGLVDSVTFVALFFLAVFLLGLVVGLALMFWRARKDRREHGSLLFWLSWTPACPSKQRSSIRSGFHSSCQPLTLQGVRSWSALHGIQDRVRSPS